MNGSYTSSNVLGIVTVTLAALAIGTALRIVALRGATGQAAQQGLNSLKTWWFLAIVFLGGALLGRTAMVLLLAATSAVAMHEFVRLMPAETIDRRVSWAAQGLIPLNYLWIWLGRTEVFVAFLPLAVLMLSSVILVVLGTTSGFVRNVSRICFGMLVTVYCPAFVVLLLCLPDASNSVAGTAGWLLFLVILTQMNDISQALIGRSIGQRRITPRVSPNKTWEGFGGGVAVSTLLAASLAPWLTPWAYGQAAAVGLVIALTGFYGDLTMSAVKRDVGVKDSGRLLPGQGGILDRIDSLTFSAPTFYYIVRTFSFGQ